MAAKSKSPEVVAPGTQPVSQLSRREKIRKELNDLYASGLVLADNTQKDEVGDGTDFHHEYQRWYTKALKAVASLAPDRLAEFRAYYEVDPKRKSLGYGTYVIQDYLKGVAPSRFSHPDFDSRDQAVRAFYNQLTILESLNERVDSVIADIEGQLFASIQDGELAVAKELAGVSLRAAGALAGVVIEGNLQRLAQRQQVKLAKKHPTIADLNDALKAAGVYDTATWRKITYLGDLRNVCCHKKGAEPTKDQVAELLGGCDWMSKNLS